MRKHLDKKAIDINKIVGEKMKSRRNNMGLTLRQVGSAVGMNPASIANSERGVQSITVRTLLMLCSVLECDYSELMPLIPKSAKKTKEVLVKKIVNYIEVSDEINR